MTHKLLANLPELTDLFAGQEVAVENGTLRAQTLRGPQFTLVLPETAFDLNAQAVKLTAQLTPAFSTVKREHWPLLDMTVLVNPTKNYTLVMQGLDALQVTVPQIEIFPGLTLMAAAATLRLDMTSWQLTLSGQEPVATLRLPGLAGVAFNISRLVINATGITECVGALVPASTQIGSLALQVSDGTLALRGSKIEARLQARFQLDYFRGASVDLQLAVSVDLANPDTLSVMGLTLLANTVPWTDPSGLLSFDQMAVTVEFTRAGPSAGPTFTSTVRIGGRVTFLPQDLAADADAWFGKLFSGLAVSFENIEMVLDKGAGLPRFAFSPPEGLHLRAFAIFDMRVPMLEFEKFGVNLIGAALRFDAGGAVVSGTVSRIEIKLGKAPSVDIALGGPALALELAAPGGFKGHAYLRQINSATMQAIEGGGRISSPALPALEATFHIGRSLRTDGRTWRPTLSVIVAREDVNVSLFPGVVATRVELGAGINRRVAGVTGLSLAQAQQRLKDGLPDVFQQESWEDAETDLCVVVRLFAESAQTQGDQVMSLYVADMTLLLTSNLQFAAFGKVWLYTSRADARSAGFQKQPAAVGLAVFDGQQPSLRVVAATRPDGRSSLTDIIPAAQLLGMQIPRAQFAFEAAPSGMTLAIGPIEVGAALGPLRVAGSTSFVLRSAGGRVYAISRSALSAAFNASTGSVNLGPATLTGSVSANFAATLALLGDFEQGRLTVYGLAHATCSIELALRVRIGFRIRISVGFGSFTISWHEDWDFTFGMHVDLNLEAALTSSGDIGVDGRASLSVNVLGISASLALHIVSGEDVVQDGRKVYQAVVTYVDKLLGESA